MRRENGAAALAASVMVGLLAACGSAGPSSTGQGRLAQHHRPPARLSEGVGTRGSTPSTTVPPTTTTTEPPPLPSGQQGPVSAIPWPSVGPGWMLAMWSPNAPVSAISPPTTTTTAPESDSLFLVDPSGGRYLVTTFPAPGPSLVAWSGDGRRALLSSSTSTAIELTEVDLTTGQTVSSFSVGSSGGDIAFTRPDGLAVLVSTNSWVAPITTARLTRFSPDGSTQLVYPSYFGQVGDYDGSFLSSADGTELVMGAMSGLAVVSNGGTVLAQLPVAATTDCSPDRWWSNGVVLASCMTQGGETRLWEVPVAGGPPAALTAPPVPPDAGDQDAWQVASGVYVQDAGGCGYEYLAKLQPNGTTAPVTVPDVESGDSQFVLGTYQGEIGLRATVHCGPGVSALWFDPATDTSDVVLGPPVNGGSVVDALLFPDPDD